MKDKFNLIVKVLAIALIIYVFAQQKNDNWQGMGKKPEVIEQTSPKEPAKTTKPIVIKPEK